MPRLQGRAVGLWVLQELGCDAVVLVPDNV
jgi:hypothetical protein